MREQIYYSLADGRCWSVARVAFADAPPDDALVIPLRAAEGRSDEEYLMETLRFYGFPTGEPAPDTAASLRADIGRLEDDLLGPLKFAGLRDAPSQARYEEFYARAAPLVARLNELLEQEAGGGEGEEPEAPDGPRTRERDDGEDNPGKGKNGR